MAAQKKPTPAEGPTRTRKVMTVEFEDGRVETFNPNRPKLLIAFEVEHGVQQPQSHQQIAWLAWHGLGRPTTTLEAFIDAVESIDADEVEVGKAPS